jgi:hypothetical protein
MQCRTTGIWDGTCTSSGTPLRTPSSTTSTTACYRCRQSSTLSVSHCSTTTGGRTSLMSRQTPRSSPARPRTSSSTRPLLTRPSWTSSSTWSLPCSRNTAPFPSPLSRSRSTCPTAPRTSLLPSPLVSPPLLRRTSTLLVGSHFRDKRSRPFSPACLSRPSPRRPTRT